MKETSPGVGDIAKLCAAIVFWSISPAICHIGNRTIPIYEIPTADLPSLSDASLRDWEDVLPDASVLQADLSLNFEFLHEGPYDLASRSFLGWNNRSQTILVGLELFDDISEAGGVGVTVLVDGDHSGGDFVVGTDSLSYSAQGYTAGARPDRDEDLVFTVPDFPWLGSSDWSVGHSSSAGEDPIHAIVEMEFAAWDDANSEGPSASQRSELSPWKVIGIQLVIRDLDRIGEPFAEYTIGEAWATVDRPNSWANDADLFADAQLIPCQRLGCSEAPTAVEVDSWARVKAAVSDKWSFLRAQE